MNLKLPNTIVNISLDAGPGWSQVFDDLVEDANKLGIAIVTGAGNDGGESCKRLIPAALAYRGSSDNRDRDSVVVGAIDRQDNRLSISDWGYCAQYYAPGDGIRAPTIGGNNKYNGDGSDGGPILYGTSDASAFVTGVLALYKEARPVSCEATSRASDCINYHATFNVVKGTGTYVSQGVTFNSSKTLVYAGGAIGGFTDTLSSNGLNGCTSNCTVSSSGANNDSNNTVGSQSIIQKIVSPFLYLFK